MALKSTIFRAELNVSDLNVHHYQNHKLTIARHPSENDERMMMRILAFAYMIGPAKGEGVEFGKGLSTDDEPDVWQKSLDGNILHWVDVGRPSEERIRKACGKSDTVSIFCFGGSAVDIWWREIAEKLKRHSNLHIYNIDKATSEALTTLAQKNMSLHFTLDEANATIGDNEVLVDVNPQLLYRKEPV